MQTQCNGNFLECMVVTPGKIPSNGVYRVSVAICYRQAKLPLAGLGCIQLSCWPRGPHGNSQNTQVMAETEGCSTQMDSRVRMPRVTPTQFIEHREDKPVPARSPLSYLLVSLIQEGTLQAMKRETGHKSSYKTFDLQSDKYARATRANLAE